ncbi:hypothetical protein F4818DRAFT_98356 [Hypoxylon cercidicola]|nr:hypothetical protein F4818DRAFT_98356 [Hypoxylon cercidicola]
MPTIGDRSFISCTRQPWKCVPVPKSQPPARPWNLACLLYMLHHSHSIPSPTTAAAFPLLYPYHNRTSTLTVTLLVFPYLFFESGGIFSLRLPQIHSGRDSGTPYSEGLSLYTFAVNFDTWFTTLTFFLEVVFRISFQLRP